VIASLSLFYQLCFMLRQFVARQPYLNLKEALGTPIGKKHEMSRRD